MWNVWDNDGLGKSATEAEVKAAVIAGGCFNEWKQAGRPQDINFCNTVRTATGGGLIAQPGGVTTLPAPTTQLPPGSATPAPDGTTPGSSSSGGDFLGGIGDIISGIPPTLLYVGGAVVLFMMLKKR